MSEEQVVGYHIYLADERLEAFVRLNRGPYRTRQNAHRVASNLQPDPNRRLVLRRTIPKVKGKWCE